MVALIEEMLGGLVGSFVVGYTYMSPMLRPVVLCEVGVFNLLMK